MTRTEREMAAGAAFSARAAVKSQPNRRKMEPWDQWNTPVFRPTDGAGTQDRQKIKPGDPGSIGHAKNLFSRVR